MKVLTFSGDQPDMATTSITDILATTYDVERFDYDAYIYPFGSGRFHRLNSAAHLAMRSVGKEETALSDHKALQSVKGRRFDLIFIVRINVVPSELIRALKEETGAVVVGWFTDHIMNLGKMDFLFAPYDRIFLKDRTVVDMLRAAGDREKYQFLAQAFDPLLHRPVPSAGDGADVATFGNSYAWRAMMMRPLLRDSDIQTVIFGDMTPNADDALSIVKRPAIYGLRKSRAMREAKIALNSNHFGELGGVNKRSFELGGMGAFQLTDGPRIHEYYEPEKEVGTFDGADDMLEKVRYFLERPKERAEIARRGLERAWSSHTYQHRLNELIQRVPGLDGAESLLVPKCPPEEDAEVEFISQADAENGDPRVNAAQAGSGLR